MSAKGKKQVRFSDDGKTQELRESLVLRKMEAPDSSSATGSHLKKKKGKKKTKLQVLKAEKKKVKKELKTTKNGIVDDNKRKASPSYTPYENRQRLARASSDAMSKLQQLEKHIVTGEKAKKEKVQKKLQTRIKKRSIRADKQHKRLIKMTTNLEKMKLEEGELRGEIARERSEDEVESSYINGEETPVRLPPIKRESPEWIRLPSSQSETCLSDYKTDGEQEDSRPVSAQSESAIQSSSRARKTVTADKLAHKYDMTRELRNTIHEHMISRSYSFSYLNIIPPYKIRKPKPQKTKQVFNRLVYEDKIGVVDFNKRYSQKAAAIRN